MNLPRDSEQHSVLPVKAVILDYGNVLSISPSVERMAPMAAIFGIEPHVFRKLYPMDRDLYDNGSVSAATHWLKFAEKAGVRLDPERIPELRKLDVELWSAVDPQMIRWVESLSAAGLKTALLSNMIPDMAVHARQEFAWMNRMTCQVLSCEIKLIKPDAAIYQHCLRRLGVCASEALFIDDLEANLEAARRLGIRGVLFRSVHELRAELIRLRSVPVHPLTEQPLDAPAS